MKHTIIILILLGFAQFAPARLTLNHLTVARLFEEAPLVVACEITSIAPLGIETTLSYPTLKGVTFHWLRVTCKVGAVLKGKFHKDSIDVAMLAVKKSENIFGFNDGPSMLSPKKGQKYVMFLAPSSNKDIYASLFAPYDEEYAIFILDRKAREYDFSGVVDSGYLKECNEKKDLVWALVSEDGQFTKGGPREIAGRYKSQIEKKGRQYKIPLEWKVQTSKGGWSTDVPKDTPEPKRK